MSLSRDEPDGIDVQAPRLSSDTSETSECTSFARSEWRCGEKSDPLHDFISRDKMSSILWSHNFIWRCAVSTSEDWIVYRKAWPCRLWSICIPWHDIGSIEQQRCSRRRQQTDYHSMSKERMLRRFECHWWSICLFDHFWCLDWRGSAHHRWGRHSKLQIGRWEWFFLDCQLHCSARWRSDRCHPVALRWSSASWWRGCREWNRRWFCRQRWWCEGFHNALEENLGWLKETARRKRRSRIHWSMTRRVVSSHPSLVSWQRTEWCNWGDARSRTLDVIFDLIVSIDFSWKLIHLTEKRKSDRPQRTTTAEKEEIWFSSK